VFCAAKSICARATLSNQAEGTIFDDLRVSQFTSACLWREGPMPVNAIGPKVDLNPGSVRVTVDRLYKKGLVSRLESPRDRRVRTVALTENGRNMFLPVFRRHAALVKRAFQDVSSEELRQLEVVLKKVGKRAASLAEKKGRSQAE
jgi:MarR family 2-MHQ and catechol resistance regulon transcriptional repressor